MIKERIIPTSEELKILREKLSNIKDLLLFKSPSMISSASGQFGNAAACRRSIKEVMVKSSSKYYTKDEGTYTPDSHLHNNHNNDNHHHHNILINSASFVSMPEKEVELLNQRYYEVQKYLEANKEKLEKIEQYDEILKENEELRNENANNRVLENNMSFKDILDDYMRMKSEFILLSEVNMEQERHILNIEKQVKLLLDLDSNTGVNKNYLRLFITSLLNNKSVLSNTENFRIISDLVNNSTNVNTVQFLSNRIDGLELQNFSLITKLEKTTALVTSNYNDLIEYSEVISDIKNVLNQVYDTQSLTTEFLIIRDTLNNKSSYLSSQKETFYEEKEKLRNESYKQINMDLLLCKDKVMESKVKMSSNSQIANSIGNLYGNKLFELLDEKIEIYDNLKNNLAQYEDYVNKSRDEDQAGLNIAENLMNENYILKTKNIKLREFITNLIKTNNFDVENIDEDNFNQLSEVINSNKDVMFSEDLFSMLKAQALMIENMIL